MRIGFAGNANNYPFMLARKLRAMGHDVRFFVTKVFPLDRPETRYAGVGSRYPPWIVDVGHLSFDDLAYPERRAREALRRLRSCDAIVTNSDNTALCPYVDRPAFVLLTGSDLEVYASLRFPPHFVAQQGGGLRARLGVFRMASHLVSQQREAIRTCAGFSYFPEGSIPNGDSMLRGIGVAPSKRRFFMMTDVEAIAARPPPRNARLRLLYPTRFTWGHSEPPPAGLSDLDDKGCDVMLRGVARFIQQTKTSVDLRLFRKGRDVRQAAELVEQLGLSSVTTWKDEVKQLHVLEEYAQADVVLEQTGRSIVGMAGLDAMASGRPVIADGNPESFEPVIGAPSPLLQARTPEQVAARLEEMLDPAARARVGEASRVHVERFYSTEHAARIVLDALASGGGPP